MAFRTKLDFSDNRQVKQQIETNTVLSGATNFGVPFIDLPNGVNILTSGVTDNYTVIFSTFSGNNTTTNYNWYDSRMQLGISGLSAITPSNSATTQTTGPIFTVSNSTTIDGNLVNLEYTGVTFDVTTIAMIDLGGGNYSGTVETINLDILSAESLDFTGRTIWADVSGITRTNKLIVTENANVGWVLTCIDSEGMVGYMPVSGSTSDYWSGSTGVNSLVPNNSDSLALGDRSIILGSNLTGTTSDTVYMPNAIINTGGTESRFGINTNTPNYTIDANSSNSNFFFSNSGGGLVGLTGSTIPRFGIVIPPYGSMPSAGLTVGIRAWDDSSYSNYGSNGDGFIYSAVEVNGLNIINAPGSGVADYIRLYAGSGPSTSTANIHITGTGSTKGYVGINLETPTEFLDVNGNIRIRSIGSTASSGALHYDSNGVLTTSTSDFRLKTNIKPITNALSKVNNLFGVEYNWKSDEYGDKRLGLIAQDVEKVVPELTFSNKNTSEEYMGVHYDNLSALLIEAIKEINNKFIENEFIKTQTIIAEDNNIELNFNGTPETALGGGIKVINAKGIGLDVEFKTDINGDWITNNGLKPNSLTLPKFTPESSSDINGSVGSVTRDDDYIYIKTSTGWKRANLESF